MIPQILCSIFLEILLELTKLKKKQLILVLTLMQLMHQN
jgi:hypothetical protein